ncbi:hypothetical protein ABT301_27815 [Streptomyces sp. NPDC000987]|uniref:hypothetical protein n=1 Tax=Streptomyces sp. NPDC000987 TaxID=3154374 RepID=UPI00331DCBD5
MTAEHDSHDGHDGSGGYAGTDALMAAITGEDLPDDARADAAFLADHRRAEADVTLLRQQLRLIGETLAADPAPAEVPAPVGPPRSTRRRVRAFAFGALATAAVATMLTGMAWLIAQGGVGASSDARGGSSDKAASDAGSPFTDPGYLACARLVAEGEVMAVEKLPADAGRERITLHVNRSYKPEKAKRVVSFLIDEDAVLKSLHKGDRILVALPQHSATPDHVLVGEKAIARERAGMNRALSASRELGCD